MTPQDLQILKELQRYAQIYFDAIHKEALTPGEYSAKQLIRDERKYGKSSAGYYVLPESDEFRNNVEITVGSFSFSFPFHDIFKVLAKWESTFRPGKNDKAIFVVGNVEIKTVPVIYQEKRNGKYIVKKERLQRVLGNYWRPAKQFTRYTEIKLIYELNGVYFVPGCRFDCFQLEGEIDDFVKDRLERWNEEFIKEKLIESTEDDYFNEVKELAGLTTPQAETEPTKEQPQETPIEKLTTAETITAPVLQYAKDGNTIISKQTTLTKIRDDAYFYNTTDNFGITNTILVLREKNVFWRAYRYSHDKTNWETLEPNIAQKWLQCVFQNAEIGEYVNNLEIEVCLRAGYNVCELRVAHDAYLRKQEEKEQQEYEKEMQALKEREQAEQKRKELLIKDAKEKILSERELTVEQIELLAESLDYSIHGRTLGMMRERITAMSINENLSVSLSGYDIKKRNVSAACDVLRELYKLVLGETLPTIEEILAPKTTETAQISAETSETKKLSANNKTSVKMAENSQVKQLPYIEVISDIISDKIEMPEKIERKVGTGLNSRHRPRADATQTNTGPAQTIFAVALSPPGATTVAPTTILHQQKTDIRINTFNSS